MTSHFEIPVWAQAVAVSLLKILRHNEPGTYEHSLRVADYSRQLATFMGLNTYQQKLVEIAGLMHDIGEATIDQDILAKPTKLNVIEYELMKSHVMASVDFIKPLSSVHPFFLEVEEVVLSHHEQVNGSGYPNKLQGEQIPLLSRIINLIDAYDSMTTSRVYKKALTVEEAYAEIQRSAGSQFDSHVVAQFINTHRFFTKPTVQELENQLYKKVA